jgi:hypothetical protein
MVAGDGVAKGQVTGADPQECGRDVYAVDWCDAAVVGGRCCSAVFVCGSVLQAEFAKANSERAGENVLVDVQGDDELVALVQPRSKCGDQVFNEGQSRASVVVGGVKVAPVLVVDRGWARAVENRAVCCDDSKGDVVPSAKTSPGPAPKAGWVLARGLYAMCGLVNTENAYATRLEGCVCV